MTRVNEFYDKIKEALKPLIPPADSEEYRDFQYALVRVASDEGIEAEVVEPDNHED